jgi:hypothetical protein
MWDFNHTTPEFAILSEVKGLLLFSLFFPSFPGGNLLSRDAVHIRAKHESEGGGDFSPRIQQTTWKGFSPGGNEGWASMAPSHAPS